MGELRYMTPPRAEPLDILQRIGSGTPVFFLDFDGTLAPIVLRPEEAKMPTDTRRVVECLSAKYPVCIVSGRSEKFLRDKVGLQTVFYATDHGHRIIGPPESGVDFEVRPDHLDQLTSATENLGKALGDLDGIQLEAKEMSLAVHYRRAAEADLLSIKKAVEEVLRRSPGLRLLEGKRVYELMPDASWTKGNAVLWVLNYLQPVMTEVVPLCLGDDITDEDMFSAIKGRGISVVVGDPNRPTQADYRLGSPLEVPTFLQTFTDRSKGIDPDVL